MNSSPTPLASRWSAARVVREAVLLLVAALLLGFVPGFVTHWRAARDYPFQLDAEEGFILDQATRLAGGKSIYEPIATPPFTVGNYTPLFPAIYGLINGPEVTPASLPRGRALAQVCALLVVALMGGLILVGTRSPGAALLGPALFMATYELHQWGAFARVDLPALALTFAGLGVAMLAPRKWGVVVAALLFAAAAYTRQTALVAPVACGLALLLRERRAGFVFVATLAAAGLLALLALQLATGGEFWRHVVGYNRNEMAWGQWVAVMRNEIGFFYRWLLLALPAAGAWWVLTRDAGDKAARTTQDPRPASDLMPHLYLGLAWLSTLGAAKAGAAPNYFLEPLAATALWLGLALGAPLGSNGAAARRLPRIACLVVSIALLLVHAGYLHSGDRRIAIHSSPTPNRVDRAAAGRVMSLLQRAPGEVFCEEPVFTLLAGREVLHEPFIMAQLAREGVWDEAPFVEMIEAGRFSVLLTTEDLREAERRFARYTPGMAAAVRTRYALAEAIPLPGLRRVYYLWRPSAE